MYRLDTVVQDIRYGVRTLRRSGRFAGVALGATRRQVIGHVLGRSLQLSLVGLTAGLLTAAGLTRFLSALLYEVAPTDPAMFTVAGPTVRRVHAMIIPS